MNTSMTRKYVDINTFHVCMSYFRRLLKTENFKIKYIAMGRVTIGLLCMYIFKVSFYML